jgi:hypothetical protein
MLAGALYILFLLHLLIYQEDMLIFGKLRWKSTWTHEFKTSLGNRMRLHLKKKGMKAPKHGSSSKVPT